MSTQINSQDLFTAYPYNPDNTLKVCHSQKIPECVWEQIKEAQEQHGATEEALKAIQSILNTFSECHPLHLANAYFNDLIKEAVLDNNIPTVLAGIKEHVERFMMCKQISRTMDSSKMGLSAMGVITLELDPENENIIELTKGDDYLAIGTACSLANIAELTYWLYLTDEYSFKGALIRANPLNGDMQRAIDVLNKEGLVKVTDKEQTDFRIHVLKLENGNIAMKLSKVVSKLIALHIQAS